jgi:hypothetical protein
MKHEKGNLLVGETHPSSHSAMEYIKKRMSAHMKYFGIKDAIASTALSGDRACEICLATLERIEKGEPVSDRYVLGLAWFLNDIGDV